MRLRASCRLLFFGLFSALTAAAVPNPAVKAVPAPGVQLESRLDKGGALTLHDQLLLPAMPVDSDPPGSGVTA